MANLSEMNNSIIFCAEQGADVKNRPSVAPKRPHQFSQVHLTQSDPVPGTLPA